MLLIVGEMGKRLLGLGEDKRFSIIVHLSYGPWFDSAVVAWP
jgi:hypothetical protein